MNNTIAKLESLLVESDFLLEKQTVTLNEFKLHKSNCDSIFKKVISMNINSFIPNQQAKFNSWVHEYSYRLTDDALAKLIKYDVKDIRVEAKINGFDYTIIDGISTKSIFKCIN